MRNQPCDHATSLAEPARIFCNPGAGHAILQPARLPTAEGVPKPSSLRWRFRTFGRDEALAFGDDARALTHTHLSAYAREHFPRVIEGCAIGLARAARTPVASFVDRFDDEETHGVIVAPRAPANSRSDHERLMWIDQRRDDFACTAQSGQRGSNPRQPAWKAGALPTELHPHALSAISTDCTKPGLIVD